MLPTVIAVPGVFVATVMGSPCRAVWRRRPSCRPGEKPPHRVRADRDGGCRGVLVATVMGVTVPAP